MSGSLRGVRLRRTRALVGCLITAGVVATPLLLYRLRDPEHLDLNDAVRAKAPGAFIRLSNGYTHYEIAGPDGGRRIVLVAGFSVPYYLWDPTFSALVSGGYRVLRYDYYGRGFSDRPDITYGQEMYVAQLRELLDAVGFTDAVDMAGVSMGAAVVTTFADQYPQRVRSLIYIDPAFRTSYTAPYSGRHPRVWSYLTAVLDEPHWPDEQLDDFFRPERFPEWPAKYRVQMQYRGFRRARLSELLANADVDQDDEVMHVGEHSRPILVIWGRQDRSVPYDLSQAVLQMLPRANLVPIDDAGHLPQIEQPRAVNQAVLDFLK